MKRSSRIFAKGVVVLAPIAGTVALTLWIGGGVESVLKSWIQPFAPQEFWFPGLGLLLGVAIVFGVGLLAHLWAFRVVFGAIENAISRAPFLKAIYGSLKDFADFLIPARGEASRFDAAVLVEFEQLDARLIGFVTMPDLATCGVASLEGADSEDRVAVYLPMSYQIGGYMAIVPKSRVKPLGLSMEDAMRLTLTAGVSASKKPEAPPL